MQLMLAEQHSMLMRLGSANQVQLTSPLLRTSLASSSLPAASAAITAVTGIVPMPDLMMKAARNLLRRVLVREPLINARGQNGQKRGSSAATTSISHRPVQQAFDVIFRNACDYEDSGFVFPPIAKLYSLPKGVIRSWTRYSMFDACY
jgi:hypothetical protein